MTGTSSAAPALEEHRVLLAFGFIAFITIANLRGVKEAGTLFAVPTYGFFLMVVATIVSGFFRCLGGCPTAESASLVLEEHSALTLFLILLISLTGVFAFLKLGRAEDPAFTVKVMTIITAWPGATPQEMQDQVAEKLEKRLQELRWYDRTETFVRPGLAFTTLTLRLQELQGQPGGLMQTAAVLLLAATSVVVLWLCFATVRGLRDGSLLAPEPVAARRAGPESRRPPAAEAGTAEERKSETEAKTEDSMNEIDYESFFSDYLDEGYRPRTSYEIPELPPIENTLSTTASLADHLEWQLRMTPLDEKSVEIGEAIIGNIDDYGYLKISVEELAVWLSNQEVTFTKTDGTTFALGFITNWSENYNPETFNQPRTVRRQSTRTVQVSGCTQTPNARRVFSVQSRVVISSWIASRLARLRGHVAVR